MLRPGTHVVVEPELLPLAIQKEPADPIEAVVELFHMPNRITKKGIDEISLIPHLLELFHQTGRIDHSGPVLFLPIVLVHLGA